MTPFESIYDKFLSLIDDYELALIYDEELDFLLSNYLSRAISLDFKQCQKDLTKFNTEDKQFDVDLSAEEQWIIATGMTLSWLESKIKHEKLMRSAISDRDYTESSNANQLQSLLKLEIITRDRLHHYIVNYSYNDFEGLY